MHTIVLATQKGGSGKSTLAIGLALAAKQAGFTVRLIETDPQGTLSNWLRRRTTEDLVVEPIYHAADIGPRLNMLADSGLQLAIVDTAAGLSAATTAAIRHSDLCLIPARPSVADIEATVSTLSVEMVASMSATLGRAGIRQRSEWRIAAVVAALRPAAVSTIASWRPLSASIFRRGAMSAA